MLVFGALVACGSPEVGEYTMDAVSVSGEFLFEGPNTLQGKPDPVLDDLASKLGVAPEDVKAVYLSGANIRFETDTLRETIQSSLVQWVSDDLELVSVATKSPLPATDPVDLEISNEQDILPYLKDPTSSVVVDVNLAQDLDALTAQVVFVFNVEYKK